MDHKTPHQAGRYYTDNISLFGLTIIYMDAARKFDQYGPGSPQAGEALAAMVAIEKITLQSYGPNFR